MTPTIIIPAEMGFSTYKRLKEKNKWNQRHNKKEKVWHPLFTPAEMGFSTKDWRMRKNKADHKHTWPCQYDIGLCDIASNWNGF